MHKLCQTKMTLHPIPHKSVPNYLQAWHKEITKPLIIPKCTGYEFKVSSS